MSGKHKRETVMTKAPNNVPRTELHQGKSFKPLLPLKTGPSLISDKKLSIVSPKPISTGSDVTEDTSNQRTLSINEDVNHNQLSASDKFAQQSTESIPSPKVSKIGRAHV